MCWYEEYDEPSTSIRVIQRRRVYRELLSTPTYSYSYTSPSYRLVTRSPSLSPRYSRSSYTTVTRTRRHTRSYDVIPERYEREPTYIEYGRRGGDGRYMNVRIIDRSP
jgi:hypothetical protein